MPRKPLLSLLIICISLVSTAFTHDIGLGSDITSLIPLCAQSCLLSFIRSNYPTADCGSDFDLQCLCPVQSLSGFTVGEAALQCLLGDLQLGQCSVKDVEGSPPSRVHNICSSVPSALPNTHSRLTATLVIPSTGAPTLLAPTPSPTRALPTSSSSSWTTIRTSTGASFTRTTSSFSSTVTAIVTTSFPVSTVASVTSGPTSAPSSTLSPSTTRLAPGQIVGISVGAAGAVAIAVGAILLAKCVRRRRYPDSDSDSEKGFYQTDNSTGTINPSGSRSSRIFHISPPILRLSRYRPDYIPRAAPPAPQPVQPEPPTDTGNVDRGTIGLAISRPRSLVPSKLAPRAPSPSIASPQLVQAPLERKRSKLLPPRPALTLDIPPNASQNGAASSQPPPMTDRTSTLTNMTAFADLDSAAAEGDQVWRPPPSDPLSATTLYIADKYGNWVLSNPHRRSQVAEVRNVAELDTYTPLTKSPIEKQEDAARMAAAISAAAPLGRAQQPAFLSQDPVRSTHNRASSLYSQASAPRQMTRRSSSGRNSMSKSRKANSGSGAGRPDSKASVTTIQTSSTGGNEGRMSYEHDIARLSQLSPVKESPDPPRGRSQIAYPKIPGRLDGATIRHVPPPKRPNFWTSTSDQTSPTLGVVYPVIDSPSAYPLPLNPQRPPRPFAPTQRTGSGFTPEPPNFEVFPPQVFAPEGGMPVSRQWPQPGPTVIPVAGSYQTLEPRVLNMVRTPPQQNIATFTPSPMSVERDPTPPEAGGDEEKMPMHIVSQYKTMSLRSSRTASSGATSLVAKRLGSDKAAALVLDPNQRKVQQWRRQEDGDGVLPFSPGTHSLASPRGTLPMTPTWLPRLTPTRRGGDLYLNVQ